MTTTRNGSKKRRRTNTKRKKNTAQQVMSPYRDEIILVVTLVVSILLVLSTFQLGGVFGKIIGNLLFGLFGFMGYLFPYLLFLSIAFGMSNKGNRTAQIKLISCTIFYIILMGISHLLVNGYTKGIHVFEFYKSSMIGKNGGGLIGGLIGNGLCYLFGSIGAYAILIGISLILIMFITERLLFAGLNQKRKQVRERRNAREKKEILYEKEEETIPDMKNKRKARVFTFQKEKEAPLKEDLNLDNLEIVRESTAEPANTVPAYQEELEQKFNKKEETTGEELQKKEDSGEEVKTEICREEKNLNLKNDLQTEKNLKPYEFPPLNLLARPKGGNKGIPDIELKQTASKLKATLESFGVKVEMKNVSCGPAVTRYELQPAQGVKVSKITSLADDIKLSLAAADIRIEAPIPGKSAVGIEVPNKENSAVMLRTLLESDEFKNYPSDIAFAVGKDIGGKTVVTDIAKMPHLLIAGATGSGKSVCINTLIMSILYKASPDDVKLIMVDPKVVELSVYNGIPHLLIPVVTDPKKASGALNWAVMEMTERYKKFADLGVRDMKGYNAKVASIENNQDEKYQKMPQIVIIVDELADLMMVAPGEVEDAICRLAQMARAAGIHLIIATQRPSVNVITGLIKANVPSRIAFSVSSAIDSRTILDGSGAEKLLGKGDMLFFPSGYPKPIRVQGAFVSDKEVSAVVEFLSSQYENPVYNEEINNKITSTTTEQSAQEPNDRDEYFVEAGRFIIEKDKASIGMLQRVFKIGFNRAARIMDQLYEAGVVGPEEGTKPRKVVMTMEEFENYIEECV
ncbi:DNA translocase FtsK [Velocimicrobium porci]|uniref:DNA translocase FtsK n=1 Tax=Velocimicrobium porci TaxID=2606634 RepID=A0A6L5XZJ4_9FIRM|nr:DNA translocase FtsK [Velocimicrobium porci]MSS63343.1 DNA translocase FtsK [Velocimicrobium porci]